MSYSATGSIDLNNVGNILYLSNNITTLSSNLTIGTSPVSNEQFYFLGNAKITGNLFASSNLLIPNGNVGIGTNDPRTKLNVIGSANIGNVLYQVHLAKRINSSLGGTGIYIDSTSQLSGNTLIQAYDGTSNISRDIYLNPSGGVVAINTNLPPANVALYVNGNANINANLVTTANANIFGNLWIKGNIIGTSNLILLNGNAGIGTSNPLYKLDVAGAANISGNLNFSGNLLQNGAPYIGSQWTTSGSNIYYNSGNVGIGTSNPLYTFDLGGDANISGNIIGNGNANVLGNLGVTGNLFASSNLYVPNGNLGVKTLTPTVDFEVYGLGKFINTTNDWEFNIGHSGNATTKGIRMFKTDSTGNTRIVSIDAAASVFRNLELSVNNLGVGKQQPVYKLDVLGNANISSFIIMNANANVLGNLGISGNIIGTSNLILLNGNLGIGTSSPTVRLQTLGNANITGNLEVTSNVKIFGNLQVGSSSIYLLGDENKLGVGKIPTYDLDVLGNINISGSFYQGGNQISGTQWTTSGSNIYYNVVNGNVGIGTSNPLYSLDLAGDANISGNIIGNGNISSGNLSVINDSNIYGNLVVGPATGNTTLRISRTATTGLGHTMLNGQMSVNKITPDTGIVFDVNGISQFTTGRYTNSGPNALYLAGEGNFATTRVRSAMVVGSPSATMSVATMNVQGNAIISGNLNVDNGLLWIDPTNNRVGILNTNPQQALDVAGSANISVDTFVRNNLAVGSTSATANVDITGNAKISGNLNVDNGTLWVDSTNNRVGVLNTNPQQALDIAGSANISVDTFVRNNLAVGSTSAGANVDITGNAKISGNLNVRSGVLWVDGATTRVGINTTVPTTAFNVNGAANIGTSTFQLQLAKTLDASGIGCQIRGQDSTGNTIIQAEQQGVSYRNLLLNPLSGATTSGNVGIGTTIPNYKLDVAGWANISSNTIMNANANVIGNLGVTGNIIGTSNIILLNGNIGVRKSNPAYEVDVTGNINFTGSLYQNGSLFTGSSQWTTAGSNIYYNVSNGNVGIGTATPLALFDVNGNARINGNLNVDNGTMWLDAVNNRLGILTTNPQQALDVKGSANVSVDTFIRNNLAVGATTAGANLDVTGNAKISGNLNIGNGLLWANTTTNRVGVLNTNPQYELDIKGAANVTGNVVINSTALFNSLQFISGSNMSTPFKMVYGNIFSGSVGATNSFSNVVTFPNAFSAVPWIILVTSSTAALPAGATDYATTGCTIIGRNMSGSSSFSTVATYLAIGPA